MPHSATALIGSLCINAAATLLAGCAVTSHETTPAKLGNPSTLAALEAVIDEPGPIEVETVIGADWHVPLSGLINLDHPAAKAAKLEQREEPIHVFLHSLRHPTRGLFMIDSGVEHALAHDRDDAAVGGLVASVAGLDELVVKVDTKSWLAKQAQPLAGVLLTHLHLDHIMGLPDVPHGTPIYTGPGEAAASSFQNLFVQGTTNQELEGHAPLNEWQFERNESTAGIAGVLDIFGDGTVWALWLPGHTEGSTAYVARSANGPVLFTGDVCHTAWGWRNAVEPGTFSHDLPASRQSLLALIELARRHPTLDVRLGHQALEATASPILVDNSSH
jgi:glyoxylase-like metal-dependent hydrolase (beta-lactamase superfamily II)